MSHARATKLSEKYGLKVQWNEKLGCYVLSHDSQIYKPLYTETTLDYLVNSIKERENATSGKFR